MLRTGWREQRSVTRLLAALDRYVDGAAAGSIPAWYAIAVGREIIGALEEMGVAR